MIHNLHLNLMGHTGGVRLHNGLIHVIVHDQVDIAWEILDQVALHLANLTVVFSFFFKD